MIRYGVDYYPEQWPEERWGEDARLMQEAGINVVRLAEFAWSKLEPREGVYDFAWLDRAISILTAHDIQIVLGTPTASPPPWLMAAHPDAFIVWANGVRATYGSRRLYCPTNTAYRESSARITRAMAAHYHDHPHVIGWQIDNEFGERCYCSNCQQAFHTWLQQKYSSLDELNTRWGTIFWSHVYTDWSQIPLPWTTAQLPLPTGTATVVANPGLALDYYRFMSDTYVSYQQIQLDILRQLCPQHMITHNLMGFGYDKLNYFDLAQSLDVVAWDNYPRGFWKPGEAVEPADLALSHATMRGLKGRNFWVMEEQSGLTGWEVMGDAPRPGEIRLWSYQGIAHGADGIIYFRWRTGRFGTEQYWHGVLDHDGRPRRRYGEVKRMGQELARVGKNIAGSEVRAEVGMILSYDSRFAFQIQANSPAFRYSEHFASYYQALHRQNVPVDVIAPLANDLSYKLVITPALYVLTPTTATQLRRYVENGGVLVITTRSGVKDESNAVVNMPLPGLLAALCGIEVSEYDSLPEGRTNPLAFSDPQPAINNMYGAARVWCDVLEPHGAEVVARYTTDYYAGNAAITLHRVGRGSCIYVGTVGDQDLVNTIVRWALWLADTDSPLETPDGIEITSRWQGDRRILFVLNHAEEERQLTLNGAYLDLLSETHKTGEVSLGAKDLLILIEEK